MIKREREIYESKSYDNTCEYKEDGYCKASLTQNPVVPCEHADYFAKSYYPPCSKKEK